MASIRQEITTRARPEQVWDALADVGNIHVRLAPGFLSNTELAADGSERLVSFANGMQARELIVDVDPQARRVAWSVVGGRMSHHNASLQVFDAEGGGSRVVWIADLLPHALKEPIAGMIAQGMAAMKRKMDEVAAG
jgi:carbon monoxide dehydrogenase subunit G